MMLAGLAITSSYAQEQGDLEDIPDFELEEYTIVGRNEIREMREATMPISVISVKQLEGTSTNINDALSRTTGITVRILRTRNKNSYCVFATSFLHINVIGDFRMRKWVMYCDPQDSSNYIQGMKIMPLCTNDLRCIVKYKIPYSKLYKHFCKAYDSQEMHPQKWYDEFVSIENSNLFYQLMENNLSMTAECAPLEYR